MASSYEKINYSLRPAKAIERKMFCEAMQKLSHFQNIEKYQYVGFGSPFFSDFSLIHRMLGIEKMTSIEQDIENSDRFEFNKPFSCIDMIFKKSIDALSEIDWETSLVLWLDYDSKLNRDMFKDINTFFTKAPASSMFIITIDLKPDEPSSSLRLKTKERKKYKVDELIKRIGRNKLPTDIQDKNLGIDGNRKIIYEIVKDQIDEALNTRNGVANSPEENINYKQLFNIYYNDGTPMLTIGGIIYHDGQSQIIKDANFEELNFYSDNNNSFKIEIPSLTFKEIYTLNELLPNHVDNKTGIISPLDKKKRNFPVLRNEDIVKYLNVYRYFPNFAEANF